MNHHHKHRTTVTEPTGDANPDNHQLTNSSSELGSASDVDARFSELPAVTSTEQLKVRVSSEGDAGLATDKLYGSDGKSMLSEFDDYVGSERNGGGGVSRGLGHGFEVGDMVWGKVKSHPWWPGHIYNEAFASPTVRRTKKEGLVLVAFFGDSSYGWFEPAQLIPFHANFAEKSKQTNSRAFTKAVEEAVDEASRRCAIGLICRCRNPDSVRPTKFQGYFSVQVQDYDPGIYSEAQIRKARYGFGPAQTLAFIKQLAIAPHGCGDVGSLSFSENKATVFGLRCALFELYDEPYAQAFGTQPLHLSDRQANPVDRPVRNPAGVPLSGPLRVAETSANEKNTSKSIKDNFKKDNYIFKCRDVASNSFQLASREEETLDAGQGSIFEKNPLAVSVAPRVLEKHEVTGFINLVGGVSAIKARVGVEEQVQPDSSGFASQEITLGEKHHVFDKSNETSEEITKSFEPIDVASKSKKRLVVLALPSMTNETSLSTHLESKTSTNVKHGGNVMLPGLLEDFQQKEQGFMSITDEVKHHKLGVDGMVKKINVQKRPTDDSNSESSSVRKKMKETLNLQPTSGHLEKSSASEKSVHLSGKLIGKPVSIGLAPRENLHSEPVEVDVSASNLLPVCNIGEVNELPQILYELQALALDPFHGVKRGIPAVVRQFFLQFRSLVYQKSLPLSPPTESGAPEIHATKSPSFGASDNPTDHASAPPFVKLVKHIVKPDDPTKDGRKRALSERQEDISAKRLKKIKDLKALAAENKAASQKSSEAQQVDVKESVVQAPRKIVKPDSTRKVEHPAKPFEPTILIINFPPKTSLPSVAELKARFARFGPIDQSGLRVFWKSLSCRVVFLHKNDAQAAYKFAVANQSLFGVVGVRYYLRDSVDSSSNISKAGKARGDGETPRIKDPAVVQHQPSASAQQPLPQPIKSILKKSFGDESVSGQGAGNGGSSKGTPRVKFILGGEESNRGEQLVVDNRNNFNNDGSAPSPVAMDFNSTNIQKVISQPSLPNLPIPTTQFTKISQHNLRSSEKPPRNIPNFINSATPTTVDISQPMILLLTRCHDVVTNLTGLLGYVPYHPL